VKEAALNFLTKTSDWVLTREVARVAGVSRVTIVQYLRELLGQGLVERKRLGRASMWRARQATHAKNSVAFRRAANGLVQQLNEEREAYLKIKTKLLADPEYAGKFVAILKGKVVDKDSDESELARRVYAKYGYVVVYIERVQREKRVLELPSPERGHR